MNKFNKTKLSITSLLSTTMPNLSLKWEGKEHVNVLSTHSLNWKIVLMHFAQGLFHQKPTDMTCNLQTFLGLSCLSLSFVKSHYGSKMCERQILRRISRLLALIQISGILHSQFSNIYLFYYFLFVKYSLSIGGVGKVISNWKYWCTHVGYLLIILI